MFRSTPRLPALLALTAVVALAVPAASASYSVRSPDATDAALAATRYTLEALRQQQGYQDLRNPDRRDSAVASRGAELADAPAPPVVLGERGFDWGDAGIGAGAVLGLLIALSGAFAVVHRRSRGADGHRGSAVTS